MDLWSIYDHVRVPNHFGTSETPFGSICKNFGHNLKIEKALCFETASQMACSRGSYGMTSSKTAFQGRKFDFEKVSKITSKCLVMLPNGVSDVTN